MLIQFYDVAVFVCRAAATFVILEVVDMIIGTGRRGPELSVVIGEPYRRRPFFCTLKL